MRIRRRQAVRLLVAVEVVATSVVAALIWRHGSVSVQLAGMKVVVLLAAVHGCTWHLSGRLMGVEHAYRLGYDAGHRDGRRKGKPVLVPIGNQRSAG